MKEFEKAVVNGPASSRRKQKQEQPDHVESDDNSDEEDEQPRRRVSFVSGRFGHDVLTERCGYRY